MTWKWSEQSLLIKVMIYVKNITLHFRWHNSRWMRSSTSTSLEVLCGNCFHQKLECLKVLGIRIPNLSSVCHMKKEIISFAKTSTQTVKRQKNDVQSIMGLNIRQRRFHDITQHDPLSLEYCQVSNSDQCRIGLLLELIEAKHGNLRIELENQEIDLIITDILTT